MTKEQEEFKAKLREHSRIAGFQIETEAEDILWLGGCPYQLIEMLRKEKISVEHARLVVVQLNNRPK